MICSKNFLSSYFCCIDTNEGFITFSLLKFNEAVRECKESIVFSYTNIFAGMVLCTALANDDVASDSGLTTVDLNA